jgi:hypothetical protein
MTCSDRRQMTATCEPTGSCAAECSADLPGRAEFASMNRAYRMLVASRIKGSAPILLLLHIRQRVCQITGANGNRTPKVVSAAGREASDA